MNKNMMSKMSTTVTTLADGRPVAAWRAGALAIGVLALGLLFPAQSAQALNFNITETEWLTWPDYCRARYLVSGAGRKSDFVGRVGKAEIRSHQAKLGNDVWHWLHHHCAALIQMDRARVTASPRDRKLLLESAQNNLAGQFNRTPKDHWFYAEVSVQMAQMYRMQGEFNEALKFLSGAMAAQPHYASSYSLASIILRQIGELEQAKEVLVRGDAAMGSTSSEIHYFLGLLYIDLNDLDKATDHAVKAYNLGYPLPGLRIKLERLGRQLPT